MNDIDLKDLQYSLDNLDYIGISDILNIPLYEFTELGIMYFMDEVKQFITNNNIRVNITKERVNND
jgi:hypothetical protein